MSTQHRLAEPPAEPDVPVTAAEAAGAEAVGTARPVHDVPVLEAFRALAAVMVVLTHVGFTSGAGIRGPWAGWLTRLDVGVALFFLLSGFLLFRPYVQAAYGRRRRMSSTDYLRRRAVRIYPALLTVMVFVWLLLPESHDTRRWPVSLWIQTAFLVQNYRAPFNGQLPGLVQTWSLVVEVSFYVALPILARLILGPRRSRPGRDAGAPGSARDVRPLVGLGLMVAIAVGWRLWFELHDPYGRQLLTLPGFTDWFAAGMALAWLRERPEPVPARIRVLADSPGASWSLALALYWLATPAAIGGPYDLAGATVASGLLRHLLYLGVATLLLVPATLGDPAAAWRVRATHPVITWLGTISFGVFLWHPMLLALVRRLLHLPFGGGGFWITLVLTLGASAGCAWLSWRLVEEPLQRRFRNGLRRPRPPGRPA